MARRRRCVGRHHTFPGEDAPGTGREAQEVLDLLGIDEPLVLVHARGLIVDNSKWVQRMLCIAACVGCKWAVGMKQTHASLIVSRSMQQYMSSRYLGSAEQQVKLLCMRRAAAVPGGAARRQQRCGQSGARGAV